MLVNTDKTRAYYSVTECSFWELSLAECGVNLDEDIEE
jgi:hypothetical protein